MMQLMRLQLAGAVLVIAVLLLAELAALALAAAPGSAFLWWLNLEVFRLVNATYRMAESVVPLSYPATIAMLGGLLVLVLCAYRLRARLALAVLSNLAFIYCGALAYVSHNPYGGAPVASAALQPIIPASFDPGWALVIYLLLGSLAGAVASHLSYLRRITTA